MIRTRQGAALLGLPIFSALRESALWVFSALGAILFVALVSYDPGDPGFSFTGEAGPVNNAVGPVGAWLSDVFFLLFGRPAYLFPIMLVFAGWLVYRARHVDDTRTATDFGIRLGGFLLTLATSSGLATLHFEPQGLPNTAGGIIGDLVGTNLANALSFLGATVLMLGLWLAGVSLFLGMSWLAAMDAVGRGALRLLTLLRIGIVRLSAWLEGRRRRQERHELVKRDQQKVAARTPPRIEPVMPALETSERAEKERQVPLFEAVGGGDVPPLSLLDDPPPPIGGYTDQALEAMSRLVELKLEDFGIEVDVVSVHPGPVVTRFELKPAPGVKVSQISNLAKDLARSLSAISVRVVEVIPGKSVVGLEIPNETRELVTLGEIVKSKAFDEMESPVTLALGKDISGNPVVADLAHMPHLLIAGTTGSGKSVAMNAMVLSLLYKSTPEEVRVIMIDPKMLELSVYEGIPHLLAPVVTDMREAANALAWSIAEMERRYKLMAALSVRNLAGYNRKVREATDNGEPIQDPLYEPPPLLDDEEPSEPPTLAPLPYVVVMIDELADLMMVVGKKLEELVARLAQRARASGIHLILATQRPSVDVITGLIKANIPARIAFQVSSKIDSRTIIDQSGADNLLSHGDMLYLPPGTSVPTRVHGAYVSDHELHRVVQYLRKGGKPAYLDDVLEGPPEVRRGEARLGATDGEEDPLYDEAIRIVTSTRRASISGVQRRLKVGYNRAARMVESMEAAGVVGPLQSNGMREVLVPPPPEE